MIKHEGTNYEKMQFEDHTTLIRLEAKVDNFLTQYIVDVKELKDGTNNRLADLENKVKKIEQLHEVIKLEEARDHLDVLWQERHDTKLTRKFAYGLIGTIGGIIAYLLQFLVSFI